ncbi:MAG TPA: hypothetical protein VGK16_01590 [Candidatus Limnocylindrales bacterium]
MIDMRTKTWLLLPGALIALVALGCTAAGAATPMASPASTPVATPKDITTSVPPVEMTDGEGDEVVTGVVTDPAQTATETYTTVGDHQQVRDGVVVATHTANDVRATGRMKVAFAIDWYTNAGPFWADASITNDKGAWTGPCTGAATAKGSFGPFSCWLTGSGAYAGWTYFQASTPSGATATTEGIIYQGAVPTP